MAKDAVIECDKELYIKLSTHLQFSITGKPAYYSDSLVDLVRRHCPDIYAMAEEGGFRFIPSSNKDELLQSPIDIRFDVLRLT